MTRIENEFNHYNDIMTNLVSNFRIRNRFSALLFYVYVKYEEFSAFFLYFFKIFSGFFLEGLDVNFDNGTRDKCSGLTTRPGANKKTRCSYIIYIQSIGSSVCYLYIKKSDIGVRLRV